MRPPRSSTSMQGCLEDISRVVHYINRCQQWMIQHWPGQDQPPTTFVAHSEEEEEDDDDDNASSDDGDDSLSETF